MQRQPDRHEQHGHPVHMNARSHPMVNHAAIGENTSATSTFSIRLLAEITGSCLSTYVICTKGRSADCSVLMAHRRADGTVIVQQRDMANVLMTSIVLKSNVTLLDVVSTRMLGQFGFLSTVFGIFADNKISVDVVATSEISISLTLDPRCARLNPPHTLRFCSTEACTLLVLWQYSQIP